MVACQIWHKRYVKKLEMAFMLILEDCGLLLLRDICLSSATPLIPPTNSPSLGDRVTATVMVPSTALNGIIGFSVESLQVSNVHTCIS